jgi:hypothetical protein
MLHGQNVPYSSSGGPIRFWLKTAASSGTLQNSLISSVRSSLRLTSACMRDQSGSGQLCGYDCSEHRHKSFEAAGPVYKIVHEVKVVSFARCPDVDTQPILLRLPTSSDKSIQGGWIIEGKV